MGKWCHPSLNYQHKDYVLSKSYLELGRKYVDCLIMTETEKAIVSLPENSG